MGLGLAISRQLTRLMEGDLTYHYESGLSVFTLTMPAYAE
jgi:signal transduction histidine kinase